MMSKNTFRGLSTIGQVHIPIQDLERSIEFYRDKLGLPFSFQTETMAFFDCGGVRLMLGLPEGRGMERTSSILYFDVDDIHEAYQRLQKREVAFVGDPHRVARMSDHDLWMAFFKDSEGNLMAIMAEEDPSDPRG